MTLMDKIAHTSTGASKRGFALLLTIVVVSVVLAVGLSLLDITVKQISLSITGRDSEVAFHGAQGGIECLQALVRDTNFVDGETPGATVNCLGSNRTLSVDSSFGGDSDIDEYSFSADWNNGEQDLCSEGYLYVIDARSGNKSVTFDNQGLVSESCADGDLCTVVFARGFNRACSELDSLRTVQRELTISF